MKQHLTTPTQLIAIAEPSISSDEEMIAQNDNVTRTFKYFYHKVAKTLGDELRKAKYQIVIRVRTLRWFFFNHFDICVL